MSQSNNKHKQPSATDNASAPRTLSYGESGGLGTAVWLSIGMHLLIGGVIFASMQFTPDFDKPTLNVDLSNIEDQVEEDEIVSAVTVDKQAVEQQANAIRERQREAAQAEQRRLAEIERRAEEARRRTEAERQRQQELAAQREREQREAEQEMQRLKERREAEEQAAQEAAERRAREEEAARQEAQRRKEEAERRAAEEAARKEEERRQAEREAQMQKELQEEMAARQRARRQQMQSEIEKYTALIAQTIQRNWNVDDSMRGKSCELTISVSPSGFVKSVTTGSGDDNVCRSARNAVLKANTLPVSEDPDIYKEMANIKLTVRPEL